MTPTAYRGRAHGAELGNEEEEEADLDRYIFICFQLSTNFFLSFFVLNENDAVASLMVFSLFFFHA